MTKRPARPPRIRTCKECSTLFEATQKQLFCVPVCRERYHNRLSNNRARSSYAPKYQSARSKCSHEWLDYGFMAEYDTHVQVCLRCGTRKETLG
jgi:hypothetical protein